MVAPEIRPEPGIRTWLQELASPQRAAVVALVFAGAAFLTFLASPRGDLAAISTVRLVAGMTLFGVSGLAVALVILRPLHRRPLSRIPAWGIAITALALPLVFALLPEAHHERLLHPESFAADGMAFWSRAGRCLMFGTLVALPIIAAIFLLDRRDRVGSSRALQAALAGGAAGNLALLLHCPLVSSTHLVLSHATVPVVLGTALFVIARRRARSSTDR
jgi:hypothetical protein